MILDIKQNKYIREKNYIRIINKKIQNYIKNPVGHLDLEYLPIKRLPNNLKYIDGYLDISETEITELPRGLVVNGWLSIQNTNISELPKGLVVKSDLSIKHTKVSELPDDIIIGGDLWCYDSPLAKHYTAEELKKNYKIKKYIWY